MPVAAHAAALDAIMQAALTAGFVPGRDNWLALDVASSEFHERGRYVLASQNRSFDNGEFSDWLVGLARQYPILSIEGSMADGDWPGWKTLTQALGD